MYSMAYLMLGQLNLFAMLAVITFTASYNKCVANEIMTIQVKSFSSGNVVTCVALGLKYIIL